MVLIVDDHEDIALVTATFMDAAGIDSHCIYDGEAAMVWIAEHSPLVVILDQSMPRMTGLEVLIAMKADPRLAKIPVLFHSGFKVDDRASAAGAVGWYVKGKDSWESLVAHVRRLLDAATDN